MKRRRNMIKLRSVRRFFHDLPSIKRSARYVPLKTFVAATGRRRIAPTVVDLFSGAGGTGIGFRKAGFRIVGAVEIDANAAETYTKNLHVRVKQSDIRDLVPGDFRRELKLGRGELDVLVGCPPCQGFSRMRGVAGACDVRNDLVLRYVEFVAEFMPRFAIFENVPGIIRTVHGKQFYAQLYEGLEKLGYKIERHEENAADFGAAQHRKRILVIAGRNGEDPPFPRRTHGRADSPEVISGKLLRWRTVRDEIGNYPSIAAGEDGSREGSFPNHIAPLTGEKVLNFLRMVPRDGGSRTAVSREHWLPCHLKHNGHVDVYGRAAWDRPSNTVTCGCTNPSKGRFAHPEQDRAFTYREAAALQGFTDGFIFYGGSINAQVGNAVPPPLAYAIAKSLKKHILRSYRQVRKINTIGTQRA